mgnify:CR=1 FL=1
MFLKRIFLIVIIIIHGMIHLFGFLKSFNLGDFTGIKAPISQPAGLIWLLAFLLMLFTVVLIVFNKKSWWWWAIIAVLISQILIVNFWSDAKFGTIANLIILAAAIIAGLSWKLKQQYLKDVNAGFERQVRQDKSILTQEDIQKLPELVQKYLHLTGSIGKSKVQNMKVTFQAEMRGKKQDWFKLQAEQHNYFDQSERLFYLDALVKGLPTAGYHCYKNGKACMKIKLLSLFPVINASGEEMFEAETVTLFNDMCFLAPATLINPRIQWKTLDNHSVQAFFTNRNTTISATLFFNEKGELTNFESMDRYDMNEMEKYKFSTPIRDYREINGYRLASYGEAIWHYPEGEFVYGKYWVKDIRYNV